MVVNALSISAIVISLLVMVAAFNAIRRFEQRANSACAAPSGSR